MRRIALTSQSLAMTLTWFLPDSSTAVERGELRVKRRERVTL
jgi:hypothetical protein